MIQAEEKENKENLLIFLSKGSQLMKLQQFKIKKTEQKKPEGFFNAESPSKVPFEKLFETKTRKMEHTDSETTSDEEPKPVEKKEKKWRKKRASFFVYIAFFSPI